MGDDDKSLRLQRLWDKMMDTGLSSKLHGHQRSNLEKAIRGAGFFISPSFRSLSTCLFTYCTPVARDVCVNVQCKQET